MATAATCFSLKRGSQRSSITFCRPIGEELASAPKRAARMQPMQPAARTAAGFRRANAATVMRDARSSSYWALMQHERRART